MSGGSTHEDTALDLVAVRAALEGKRGPAFWKSLEAVAATAAFRRFLEREYPAAAHLAAGPDRRGFFKLMAASFAMAGLAACGDEVVDGRRYEVPYVRQPESVEPGRPLVYASAALLEGYANGILVTTVDGRPIKIEGNPSHPWSGGGTDIFGQASVLDLYDPARSQTVRYLDRIADWDTFRLRMLAPVAQLRAGQGRGLRLLTGPMTSPSLVAQIHGLLAAMPEARWHMVQAPGDAARLAASQAAFGVPLDAAHHFDRAKVIVAFDGDFLDAGPRQVGDSRRYAAARQASAAAGHLLTLHTASSTPSLTSAKADHHLLVEPGEMPGLVDRLAAAVSTTAVGEPAPGGKADAWLARVAAELRAARGEAIVMAGAMQEARVHEAVHRLNAALGNNGRTITFTDPVPPQAAPLGDLVAAMQAGAVDTLFILDANPVYEAPGGLGFAPALAKVRTRIHAGATVDETALRCDWHLPLSHPLESWADARSPDGTASLIQPTIAPLTEGRTGAEILSLLFEPEARDAMTIVKSFWRGGQDAAAFEPAWHKALNDGFWADTAAPPRRIELAAPAAPQAASAESPTPDGLTLLFRLDPTIRAGAHAANAWLQELPKPLTKIVWENVVALSPALAARMGIASGDLVRVSTGGPGDGAHVEAPAWIVPGQAERTLTMTLGYGRHDPDMIYDGLGYDPGPLRLADDPWRRDGVTLARTGHTAVVATTQDHNTMEGHDFIRVARPGDGPQRPDEIARSLYGPSDRVAALDEPGWEPRAWGMVIDLDACIGCNACVIACQAENNIAVVGKAQVASGRAMHWLRVDRYYSRQERPRAAALDDPDTHFQPVPCMHCETGALRGRLPGRGDAARPRGPEPHGLQPLRRHPRLLRLLPLQGAALQLPRLHGRADAAGPGSATPT